MAILSHIKCITNESALSVALKSDVNVPERAVVDEPFIYVLHSCSIKINNKKLSYRREAARCLVLLSILVSR